MPWTFDWFFFFYKKFICAGNSQQPPRIQLNPSYVDVVENSPAAIECFSPTNGQVWYQWTRVNGEISSDVEVSDGILRFAAVRHSDAGDYECLARNENGEDTRVLHVYVRNQEPEPTPTLPPTPERVTIEPSYFSGRQGDVVVLRCHSVIDVYATLVWSKDGRSHLPPHINVRNGVLTIADAVAEDSGRYTCTSSASTEDNPITEIADVRIVSNDNGGNGGGDNREPPVVKPLEDMYLVTQGTDFSLVCEASGNPYPQVKWTKLHEEIGPNVQINGNTLRILNAQPDNRGVYLCTAESGGQSTDQNTVVEIERKLNLLISSLTSNSFMPFLYFD